MELTLKGLSKEFEYLRMRVTVLEQALETAGIPIPPTRIQLAAEAQAEGRDQSRDPWREG